MLYMSKTFAITTYIYQCTDVLPQNMKCYKSIINKKKLKEDTCSAAEIAPFVTLNQLVHITAQATIYT